MEGLGKIAWDAYVVAVGGTTFDDNPLPTWEELGERQKMGWNAAAAAVAPADDSTAGQPTWDDNGWSIETLHSGLCVKNRAVEMFLEDLALNGDEFDKAAAQEAPHWFAVMVPGRDYTKDQELLLDRSRPERLQFITGWLGGMFFSTFYPNSVATSTGPGGNQVDMDLGEPAPKTGPNGVITPVKGDAADDDHEDVVEAFKRRVNGLAYRLRRAAITGNPKVSPNR